MILFKLPFIVDFNAFYQKMWSTGSSVGKRWPADLADRVRSSLEVKAP